MAGSFWAQGRMAKTWRKPRWHLWFTTKFGVLGACGSSRGVQPDGAQHPGSQAPPNEGEVCNWCLSRWRATHGAA